ncbi:cell wall-binding repeat-containing protein [Glutamicibacter arilaitensis]|uniref:cell wall-binding repeat-containing protein n=1 Tax=Glutamicibacter arilaitensis TaxID=256701 RepID=UPI003FCF5408
MPAFRTRRSKTLAIAVITALTLPLSAGPSFAAPATDSEAEAIQATATTKESAIATSATAALSDALEAGTDIANQDRVQLAERAIQEQDLEFLDAQLGQGAKRIAESGDPTIPTLDELSALANPKSADTPASIESRFGSPAALSDLRTWRPPGVLGIDVSHHQGKVNWSTATGNNVRFAYMKATQSWPSTLFKDPQFNTNYSEARKAGVLRGAYHFAMPAHSSGTTQANEFLANGGGWTNDGQTLPPLLDIEWNPYTKTAYPEGKGDTCYGMSPAAMVKWIQNFGNTIKSKTGRLPMIYTAQSWWDECTADSTAFKSWPLHVSIFPTADVPKNPRELPEGWTTFNVWQYSSNSDLLGSKLNVDANVWNGDLTSLRDFAKNTRSTPYKLSTNYFGDADVWPTRLKADRIWGATRYETPVAISKRTYPGKASTVVIASGGGFADALSGSPLATLNNAPMLLVERNSIPTAVATELKRLDPDNIIVLGGPIAVSDKTVSSLKSYGKVSRIWGDTLYDTSAKIADKWNTSSEVFLATGERFEDAMSLAAVAAGKKSPMLLTKQGQLPAATIAQLKRLKPSHVYLAGGPIAISDAVERKVRATVPNATVVRLQGATLYDTSSTIAKKFWTNGSQRQFIATATDFADGLTGAVVAAYNGAPLLLSNKSCMPSSVASAMRSMDGWSNILLGGPYVLDDTVAYKKNGQQSIC